MRHKRVLNILFALLMTVIAAHAANLKTVVLSIDPPMECSNCESRVTSSIADIQGVKSVSADRQAQTVKISYDDKVVSVEAICAVLTRINCRAIPLEKKKQSDKTTDNGDIKETH